MLIIALNLIKANAAAQARKQMDQDNDSEKTYRQSRDGTNA